MEKTQKLEIQVTKVQKDVSYLKEKVDNVDIKLDKMDTKTEKIMKDLPEIFEEIMRNYVTKDEYKSFKEEVRCSMDEHAVFDKRLGESELRWKVASALGGLLVFVLSFGETIVEWLSKLIQKP